MHHRHERATNLFARLFSYAPRPIENEGDGAPSRRRNALEDFCTEALAWCLISSKDFSKRVFALDCLAGQGFCPQLFEVDTQTRHSGEDPEAQEIDRTTSRFDLVLTASEPVPFMVIIECKVAPDRPENIRRQIAAYRTHLNGEAFKSFAEKRIILLTPFASSHGADSHLSWDQVHDVLREVVKEGIDPQRAVLLQFADFLKLNHLAKMKVPKSDTLLASLKAVAPLLAGWNAVFESLLNPEIGRSIFTRRDVKPKMDFHPEDDGDHFWYGIWSSGPRPTYYVGFHSDYSGNQALYLSVQVSVDGDHRSAKPPKQLGAFTVDLEDDFTHFVFATPVGGALDGNAGKMEEWITERLQGISEWLETLSVTRPEPRRKGLLGA